MNARQAYRLACAYNAHYLFHSDAAASMAEELSEVDDVRFMEAQKRVADELMRKSGLGASGWTMNPAQMRDAVMGASS